MLTKNQKHDLVKDLKERLSKIKSAVFADFTGLSVAKMTELRRKFRQEGVEMKVAKKTLIDLAAKEANIENVETKKMTGQIVFALGYEDEIAPAKILHSFAKTEEKLKVLGGIFEKKFVDAKTVISLAMLPSKQELLARAVGSIASPLSGLVNVLQGNLKNLIYVLSQIKQKRCQ